MERSNVNFYVAGHGPQISFEAFRLNPGASKEDHSQAIHPRLLSNQEGGDVETMDVLLDLAILISYKWMEGHNSSDHEDCFGISATGNKG